MRYADNTPAALTDDEIIQHTDRDEYDPEPPENIYMDGAARTAIISMGGSDRRITVKVKQHYRGEEHHDYRTKIRVWIDSIPVEDDIEDLPDADCLKYSEPSTLRYYGEARQKHDSKCAAQVADSVLDDPEALIMQVYFGDDEALLYEWGVLLEDHTEDERDSRDSLILII